MLSVLIYQEKCINRIHSKKKICIKNTLMCDAYKLCIPIFLG